MERNNIKEKRKEQAKEENAVIKKGRDDSQRKRGHTNEMECTHEYALHFPHS
jgi:hypothetical protein